MFKAKPGSQAPQNQRHGIEEHNKKKPKNSFFTALFNIVRKQFKYSLLLLSGLTITTFLKRTYVEFDFIPSYFDPKTYTLIYTLEHLIGTGLYFLTSSLLFFVLRAFRKNPSASTSTKIAVRRKDKLKKIFNKIIQKGQHFVYSSFFFYMALWFSLYPLTQLTKTSKKIWPRKQLTVYYFGHHDGNGPLLPSASGKGLSYLTPEEKGLDEMLMTSPHVIILQGCNTTSFVLNEISHRPDVVEQLILNPGGFVIFFNTASLFNREIMKFFHDSTYLGTSTAHLQTSDQTLYIEDNSTKPVIFEVPFIFLNLFPHPDPGNISMDDDIKLSPGYIKTTWDVKRLEQIYEINIKFSPSIDFVGDFYSYKNGRVKKSGRFELSSIKIGYDGHTVWVEDFRVRPLRN